MPPIISPSAVRDLELRKQAFVSEAEGILLRAREQGREQLTSDELLRFNKARRDIAHTSQRLDEALLDRDRSTIPARFTGPTATGHRRRPGTGRIDCRPGSEMMPIEFGVEELRAAHAKVLRQEPCLLETRASNSASSLLPPELFPVPTFPIHEGRIADHLPAFALEAPSLEYIQVNSVSGAATVVPEGQTKPEIVLTTTQITASAEKIAAHMGLTWESIQDWDAFTASATTELQRLVVDAENSLILSWLNTTGILTHAATAAPTPPATTFDDIEQSIAALRVGPALATADLLILNPASWSAIRRQKDSYGRYYVAPDPSRDEVDQVWGVPVLETTVCPDGEGWLLDTTKFGRLAVRETLALRIGYSGTDFVTNVLRYVCEERCVLTVERPAAVLHITTLPTAATTGSSKPATKTSR
jgi:capsid protein